MSKRTSVSIAAFVSFGLLLLYSTASYAEVFEINKPAATSPNIMITTIEQLKDATRINFLMLTDFVVKVSGLP